jgi:hypothetical protein
MFHVERNLRMTEFKRMTATIFLFFLFTSCIGTRERTTIPDYLVLPNGKDFMDKKGLNAFIFENLQDDFRFHDFLIDKFALSSIRENDFVITISGEKFKILVYDNNELEKYFRVSDFIITNQNPNPIDNDTPKFIAISLLSETNEDSLSEQSIFYNLAVNYLKKLKDEYNSK